MLAISPRFSSFSWFLDDPNPINISHDQISQKNNYSVEFSKDTTTTTTQISNGNSINIVNGLLTINDEGDKCNTIIKKMNHNARERARRKRMNTLYCALRSLLPPQDHSRKLSIPATVSRVTKYIPELRKEVKKLVQKKESLIMRKTSLMQEESSYMADSKNQIIRLNKSAQSSSSSSSATISVTPVSINNGEIVIQSSMPKDQYGRARFSEALAILEHEYCLVVLSASCFESCEGRIFYNLHLQAQGMVVDAEILKEKLWSFYNEKSADIVAT